MWRNKMKITLSHKAWKGIQSSRVMCFLWLVTVCSHNERHFLWIPSPLSHSVSQHTKTKWIHLSGMQKHVATPIVNIRWYILIKLLSSTIQGWKRSSLIMLAMTVSPTINVDVGFPALAFGQLNKTRTFSAFFLHVLVLPYSFFWITYQYVGGGYCTVHMKNLTSFHCMFKTLCSLT